MNFLTRLFGRRRPKNQQLIREIKLNRTEVGDFVWAIAEMGRAAGWKVVDWQENIWMLSFKKEDMRINVYTSTMTVATVLNHPTRGKDQLYRRNVNKALLADIFANPRIHTGRGYYRR